MILATRKICRYILSGRVIEFRSLARSRCCTAAGLKVESDSYVALHASGTVPVPGFPSLGSGTQRDTDHRMFDKDIDIALPRRRLTFVLSYPFRRHFN